MFGATTPILHVSPLICDIFGNMLVYEIRENKNLSFSKCKLAENDPHKYQVKCIASIL